MTLTSMTKRRRCTECRQWFTPAVTTGRRQKTCGPGCRLARRRKQARGRRVADLEEHRADERERQRKAREARRGERSAEPCHAPASPRISAELLMKIHEIVDEAARLSRTGFEQAARRILRQIQALVDRAPAQDGTAGAAVTDRLRCARDGDP